MIIYNKYNNKKKVVSIPKQAVKPKTPPLTKKHKQFLKSLNLRLKNND